MLGDKLISPEDRSLYRLTDNVETAVDEILQFFRAYHSMRYVKNKLVLRLTRRPTPELLARINGEFADILVAGDFTLGGPLSEERDEPALAALPRLIFRFNRRSLGRLRELINLLNSGPTEEVAAVPTPEAVPPSRHVPAGEGPVNAGESVEDGKIKPPHTRSGPPPAGPDTQGGVVE